MLVGCLWLPVAERAWANRPLVSHEVPESGQRQGLKSKLIRELTELLAKAIREGGSVASWIIEQLDASAARAFRKHAGKMLMNLSVSPRFPT